MKQLDYIVVGLGIGGLTLSYRLIKKGLSIKVFDGGGPRATSVAAGVVNPVVLKRINPVWRATQFVQEASHFYKDLEHKLGQTFIRSYPLLRVFASTGEQNQWIAASDRPELRELLQGSILANENPQVAASYGYGRVNAAFKLDTNALLDAYSGFLDQKNLVQRAQFDHDQLQFEGNTVRYKEYRAKRIVFCEGVGALSNPLFTKECLIPKKGEYIRFKATQLKLSAILKGPYFIVPLGDDLYEAGATFAHGDLSPESTDDGMRKLTNAVSRMIRCPFEVIGQTAGMRPTVKDRRPLLGRPDTTSPAYVLNGFGTRGLLMAPLLSKWLIDHIEQGNPLPAEVAIDRFSH